MGFYGLQENLRQLCVFKLANESNVPWKWWEYVTKFGDECKMSQNQYNEECAERVRDAQAGRNSLLHTFMPEGLHS